MTSKNQKTVIVGLVVALVFVLIGTFIFSYSMETLDKQAEQLGAEEKPVYNPPFPDYSIAGFENEWGALLIGIAGTLLLFIAGLGVAKILHKKRGNLK
jgi:hypothetical protein